MANTKIADAPANVTISDVARLAGVSLSTASCALNGKSGKYNVAAATRETVLRAAEQLNFRPNPHALGLSKGRCTNTVVLLVSYLDLGVVTRKLQLLQLALNVAGYEAPIHVCGRPAAAESTAQVDMIRGIRMQRPAAIVFDTSQMDVRVYRELQNYIDEGGIVISYDYAVEIDCDTVVFDREHNTYLATRHLLELGHRFIGLFATWPIANPERVAGFQRAIAEFEAEKPTVWLSERWPDNETNEDGGALLAQEFLALTERPTAMCIADDVFASAFITAIQHAGLQVPADLSVIGQDDMPVGARVCPVPLTTVSQPIQEIVSCVIDLLQSRLAGGATGPARRRDVRGELIVRSSTAPLSQKIQPI